ncbi:MAG: bacteriohemerythrin [Nitrospiraceae bacterium]|nr:bacteriohemerythrin [Nitrospiraceae bacterium]
MEWTEDLRVGNETIDEQHKELFRKINDLVLAINQSVCKYKISDVIKFLDDYIVFHFGEEEQMMLALSYPGYKAHKAQHEHFKRNFQGLKQDLSKLDGGKKPGSYDLSVRTNQIVVDWILEHIARVDKVLGGFLKQ